MNLLIANQFDISFLNRHEYISVIGVFALLAVVAFFLIINKVFNKKPLKLPVDDNLELKHYTFAFEETHVNVKQRSLPIRISAYVISALLILTPLSELFGQISYYYIWYWIS